MLVQKEAFWGAGSLDRNQLNHMGAICPIFAISGRILDFDLLNQLMGECATTGPAVGLYTHKFDTSVETRAAVIPSFQIWEKLANPTGANTKYLLHCGCVIRSATFDCDNKGSPVICTLIIEYGRTIAGAALTTEPSMVWPNPYEADDCTVTFTVGGAAYSTVTYGWTVEIANMIQPQKAQGEQYPERALYGTREIIISLDNTPKSWAEFTDAETDPGTAKDIDITIKLGTGTTYTQFAMEKAWAMKYSYGAYSHAVFYARYLRRKFAYIMNTRETGYKFIMTQVDANDGTRFT
jgi:hypothetical protein